mgnify:CR=1 FL=1
MNRSVTWLSVNSRGVFWMAYLKGSSRGYVAKLGERRFVVSIRGRRTRYYCPSMRDAAKQLVAFVNSISPGIIP